jgi:hypothetical protein
MHLSLLFWGRLDINEKTLKKFHDMANSIHPRIKIELKFSKNQIEFLDTITVLDNGLLKTKLYEKPRCVNLSFFLLLSFSYSSLSSQIRLTLTPKLYGIDCLTVFG